MTNPTQKIGKTRLTSSNGMPGPTPSSRRSTITAAPTTMPSPTVCMVRIIGYAQIESEPTTHAEKALSWRACSHASIARDDTRTATDYILGSRGNRPCAEVADRLASATGYISNVTGYKGDAHYHVRPPCLRRRALPRRRLAGLRPGHHRGHPWPRYRLQRGRSARRGRHRGERRHTRYAHADHQRCR